MNTLIIGKKATGKTSYVKLLLKDYDINRTMIFCNTNSYHGRYVYDEYNSILLEGSLNNIDIIVFDDIDPNSFLNDHIFQHLWKNKRRNCRIIIILHEYPYHRRQLRFYDWVDEIHVFKVLDADWKSALRDAYQRFRIDDKCIPEYISFEQCVLKRSPSL